MTQRFQLRQDNGVTIQRGNWLWRTGVIFQMPVLRERVEVPRISVFLILPRTFCSFLIRFRSHIQPLYSPNRRDQPPPGTRRRRTTRDDRPGREIPLHEKFDPVLNK